MIQYMAMLRTHIFDAARNLMVFDVGMSAHGFSPIGSPRTVTEIQYYVALGHHASCITHHAGHRPGLTLTLMKVLATKQVAAH